MFVYLINQTNPGNKRTFDFKKHFSRSANNTLEVGNFTVKKSTPPVENPIQKNIYEISINRIK